VVAVIIKIFLIVALANWLSTFAAAAENLYRAQTIVTGQGEAIASSASPLVSRTFSLRFLGLSNSRAILD
jgi:hypothetical protein